MARVSVLNGSNYADMVVLNLPCILEATKVFGRQAMYLMETGLRK